MKTGTVNKVFIIGKKGSAHVPLRLSEICLFYYYMKITFAVDASGGKYIIDTSLNDLENMIPPEIYFRVTRQIILNINSIKEFRGTELGKIAITLKAPELLGDEQIIVSQPTVPLFKEWISKL